MSDTLVQYLREARATEAGLAQTLKVHIAATPVGRHRARLEEHLEATHRHEQLLAARIEALGHGGEEPLRQALALVAWPVGFSLGMARGAARAMLSLVGLPLSVMRDGEAHGADQVLRNARAEAASEALEIATYTAIGRLAESEGDTDTARLAAEIRDDEEAMLEYLRDAVVELSDTLARSAGFEAPAAAPPRREARRRGHPRAGERRAGEDVAVEPIPIREEPGDGAAPPRPAAVPPRRGAGQEAPRAPARARPAAPPRHVSEEPELVAEVGEPGAEEPAGAEVDVQEPWEGYDRMSAAEVQRRLEDAADELVAVVRLYEAGRKNRQTVIRAAERRLRVR